MFDFINQPRKNLRGALIKSKTFFVHSPFPHAISLNVQIDKTKLMLVGVMVQNCQV